MKILNKYFIIFSIFCLLSDAQIALANVHNADSEGTNRVRQCFNTSTSSYPEGLDWNPTTGGDDIMFDMTNPVCQTVAITSYAAVKAAIMGANISCGRPPPFRVAPSPVKDAVDIALDSKRAVGNAKCLAGVTTAIASLGVALAEISVIYGIARSVYERAHICGYNWMANNKIEQDRSSPDYKAQVQSDITKIIQAGDPNQLLNLATNKEYREWYYGGVEVEDSPGDGSKACLDVTECANGSHPLGGCGGSYHNQRYYMHGFQTPNFGCEKYNIKNGQNDPLNGQPVSGARLDELKTAYSCCQSRSAKYICIEYDPVGDLPLVRKFCTPGSPSCSIEGITFAVKSISNDQILCAETYSLCPYNFSLDGGSTTCDYYKDGIYNKDSQTWDMVTSDEITAHTITQNCDAISVIRNGDCTYNDKAGKCTNYCQYMNNCVMTDSVPYNYVSGITSPYFSNACIDFVGDAQNPISVGEGSVVGAQRHLTAPIAQCVKETLENVFYNRAGHTQCRGSYEIASPAGICPDGQYAYKKGQQVTRNDGQTASFFAIIQSKMQLIVQMFLTLSIMFYGTKILLGVGHVTRKELVLYIVKMGLVIFFTVGTAWQDYFFDGVYNASAALYQMVFKVQTSTISSKRDGCQFGNVTDSSGSQIIATMYPAGESYLALWDTLDCKISRYLGFGPEVSVANLAELIFAGFFTEPVGVYFAVMLMIFGFCLLAMGLRALHIFLSSAFSIIIMVYVSPIVILASLFERTNEIFKHWLTQLISFCVQPMILFAYIALFLNVMDNVMVGSATFSGPQYSLSCQQYCTSVSGGITYDNGQSDFCTGKGDQLFDPESDSFICITNINSYGTLPILQIFGISVPMVMDLFTKNGQQKIITVMKGALIMYILAKFMDEIPAVASALTGGVALPGSGISAGQLFNKTLKVAREIEKRGMRGVKKGAGKIGENIKGRFSNSGKKEVARPSGGQASDKAVSGDNTGADKAVEPD